MYDFVEDCHGQHAGHDRACHTLGVDSPSARRRIPPMARHGSVLNARAAAWLSDEVDGSKLIIYFYDDDGL